MDVATLNSGARLADRGRRQILCDEKEVGGPNTSPIEIVDRHTNLVGQQRANENGSVSGSTVDVGGVRVTWAAKMRVMFGASIDDEFVIEIVHQNWREVFRWSLQCESVIGIASVLPQRAV